MTNLVGDMTKNVGYRTGLDDHAGPVLAERDSISVIDCSQCGYAHATRWQPIDYATDFWQTRKAGELQHFLDQREWWDHVYDAWLSRLEQLAPGRKMFDVGCGYGFWLARALARGWGGLGIEPSEEASEYASELTENRVICCATWDDWIPGQFSAVTAHWLLEHLPNPGAFLKWCYEALEPGGVLMLVLPNEWTKTQQKANEMAERPFWWVDAPHYGYFSWDSLEALLEQAGFDIIDRMGTFQMEDFITWGMDYTDRPELGRAMHRRVETLELGMTPEQLLISYWKLGGLGDGRDIVAFCRRASDK